MRVWIMNLKDNRDDKPAKLEKSKFEFCKEKGIVGIGWAGYDAEVSEDGAFLNANNYIDSFEKDDLVWVKNDVTEEYYICRITEKATTVSDSDFERFDVGKYCLCEYIFVGTADNLPTGIATQELISRRTISKANDNVNNITEQYYCSSVKSEKKVLFCSKKILIPTIAAALVIICGGFFIIKMINKSNNPILPNNLNFGDEYDTIATNLAFDGITEDKVQKNYGAADTLSSMKDFFHSEKLTEENTMLNLSFNTEMKLYEVSFDFIHDKSDEYKEIMNYYSKSLNARPTITGDAANTYISIENEIIYVNIVSLENSCIVRIWDKNLEPDFFIASDDQINDAYSSCKYKVSGFSVSLTKLLSACAPESDSKYMTYRDNKYLIDNEICEKYESGEYADYLCNSYIVKVRGEICENPDLPYMSSEDKDIVTVLLVFDEKGEFLAYDIAKECSELNTFAILYMFS